MRPGASRTATIAMVMTWTITIRKATTMPCMEPGRGQRDADPLRLLHRAVRGVQLHATCAGRLADAVVLRLSLVRLTDAEALEPCGICVCDSISSRLNRR